jgi:gag-pre-integrase-like protein
MKKHWLLSEHKSGLYVLKDIFKSATCKESVTHLVHKGGHSETNQTTLLHCKNSSCNTLLNKEKLWHLRLGHLPFHRLQLVFPEINKKFVKSNVICTICPLGRQTRTTYPKSICKSTKPLELLRIDIWGPFRYLSRLHCSMFISIVDDFSKMTWIFLIKHKSEFVNIFRQFVLFIEKQLGTHVKCVRTDNAR